MNKYVKTLIGFNLFVLIVILYLFINGKNHVENFFIENIIDVRHEQKLSMFRACPVDSGAIIFLGNSITEGGNWAELFKNQNVLNRGIGGDVASGVLSRIDEVARHLPSKLFVCIGTNDLARGIEIPSIIEDYKAILNFINKESPQTSIYVQSVLPVGANCLFGHKNEPIVDLNSEIQKMCSEFGTTYIDLHSKFSNDRGELNNSFTNDDLHLTGNAYLLWRDALLPFVEE